MIVEVIPHAINNIQAAKPPSSPDFFEKLYIIIFMIIP